MKRIEGKIRKASDIYGLIENGDKIAVGVSGGKDSVALVAGLAGLSKYYNKRYEITAVSLDPCFDGEETDFSAVTEMCASFGIKHYIKRTNLAEVIFEIRKENNPCSLCARMRRGALHDICNELGCNKIALGHHMDDVVETFFMNLFHEGRTAAFYPKTWLSRKEITMIRPLVLCTEAEIKSAMARQNLPIIKSRCPMDGVSERQNIKYFIKQKEKEYPGFLQRTFTALQNANISGFGV